MKSIWIFVTIIVVLAIIYGIMILNESKAYKLSKYNKCVNDNLLSTGSQTLESICGKKPI